jgi:hypothetical protein
MFENKFNKYLFILLVFIGLTVVFLWNELVDLAGEGSSWVGLSSEDTGRAMQDSEFINIRGVHINGERNTFTPIQITDLNIAARSKDAAMLAFRIVSQQQGGGFPKLIVSVLSKDGVRLRTEEFGPNDYKHGIVLSSEIVNLTVEVKPGDASFTVTAI